MADVVNRKDGRLWSSTGIVHSNKKLSEVLNFLLGEVLFENGNGESGNITLSETSSNFRQMEIFYKSSDNTWSSVKLDYPNGKRAYLSAGWSSATLYHKSKIISIDGNKITNQSFNTSAIANNKSPTTTSDNLILITKVVGHR